MKLLCISLFLLMIPIQAWQVLSSSESQTRGKDKTFSFPVNSYLHPRLLIVGAAAAQQAKEYALAIFDSNENKFKGCAHENVVLNGQLKQLNPLYNNGIVSLAFMGERALAVQLQSDPNHLFMVELPACNHIFSTPIIKDAQGNETDAPLVALAEGNPEAFVAVKGNGEKLFGTGGSGIAVVGLHLQDKEVEVSKEELEKIKQEAQGGDDEQALARLKEIQVKDGKQVKKIIEKKLVQAYTAPFSLGSSAIKIGKELAAIEGITMHWCPYLQCLYVGLCAQGNNGDQDGICGLAVGSLREGKLVFTPFIGENLINDDANQCIVAAKGSNQAISIHNIQSMYTTTSLDYLIVHGGRGASDQTKKSVYALPLLNFRQTDGKISADHSVAHGTLAHSKSGAIEIFAEKDKMHLFLSRHFMTAPACPAQVISATDSAAMVGNGPLAAGPIEHISVKDDAVYALVNQAEQSYTPGIYYSQAIFAGNGTIAAWTAWQLCISSQERLFADATLISSQGAVVAAVRGNDNGITTIARTNWVDVKKSDANELSSLIEEHFPVETGGVHALFEYESYLGILGLAKVALIDLVHGTDPLLFADDCLQKLGPLTAAQMVNYEGRRILLVGGVYGLAKIAMGLSEYPAQKVGDYQLIRKIIIDYPFAYILTDKTVDRIAIEELFQESGTVHPVRLATAQEIFFDLVVSEKFALLADNTGLYRVGNGKDIRSDDQQGLNWTPVAVPDGQKTIMTLVPISMSGSSTDVARSNAGQIYVISGSRSNNTARLNRFALSSVVDKPIDDTIVVPVKDFITPGHISHLVNIGNFSPLFATDGAMFFTIGIERRKQSKIPVLFNSFRRYKNMMPLSLPADSSINCIMHHRKSGSWIVGGDFGLIINE